MRSRGTSTSGMPATGAGAAATCAKMNNEIADANIYVSYAMIMMNISHNYHTIIILWPVCVEIIL